MRDSERQKTYSAENSWAWNESLGKVTLDEATDIIDLLAQDFEIRQPNVIHNPKLGQFDGMYRSRGHRIEFLEIEPTLKTVLHEFAHALVHSRHRPVGRAHGGRFIEAMLDTVRIHFGKGITSRRLRNCFLEAGLATSAAEEDAHEDKVYARRRSEEDRVGEKGPLYVVSYLRQDGRVWFIGRGTYLEREQIGVKVFRRRWAAARLADSFTAGITEVHEIPGIFAIPEWTSLGYPGETPRWLPINDQVCDEVAAARERQIMKEEE